MSDFQVPKLDKTSKDFQLVDGNNYLLARFTRPTDSLGLRGIANDINSCQFPPIFVFDGVNNNARRRALYPGYKIRTPEEQAAKENVFPSVRLMKALMAFCGCVTVEVPNWEADDVLATLALGVTKPVRILTTDKDLSQLCVHPHITVTSEIKGVPPEYVRLYKTLVGDKSDKIKGVPNLGDAYFKHADKDAIIAMLQARAWPKTGVHNNYGLRFTHYEWMESNFDKLLIMWDITGLMTVPQADINANTKVGIRDDVILNKIMAEYLL